MPALQEIYLPKCVVERPLFPAGLSHMIVRVRRMSSARMVGDAPKAALLTMTVDDLSASQDQPPAPNGRCTRVINSASWPGEGRREQYGR